MKTITQKQISHLGKMEDRKNQYDDSKEMKVFRNFCKKHGLILVDHPKGQKDVDCAVYDKNGELQFYADLERSRKDKWNNDWPYYWSRVSFLQRKDRYIDKDDPFKMVWFNHQLTKIIVCKKEQILKYPIETFEYCGKIDIRRSIPFDETTLFGTGFSDREKSLFKNRKEIKL